MDAHQLETLFQFSRFLEIVSNPQELKQFLVDAKEVLDKQQLLLGLINTKEKADEFLSRAQKASEEANLKIQQDEEIHQKTMNQERADIYSNKVKTDAILKAASERENASFEREKVVSERENQLSIATKEAKEFYLANKEKEATLLQKEIELNDKANKLKELLG